MTPVVFLVLPVTVLFPVGFPDWLLERRRRAERAPTTVVATCHLLEVSTQRMEKLVETLGITRLSKSRKGSATG